MGCLRTADGAKALAFHPSGSKGCAIILRVHVCYGGVRENKIAFSIYLLVWVIICV